MKWMLAGCSSLSSLKDISKWFTNNVNDMSWIFQVCSSLSSLKDISKWYTNNVSNMSSMYKDCYFYYINHIKKIKFMNYI